MQLSKAFFAYSSDPAGIGATVERSNTNVKSRTGYDIKTWKHLEICGQLLADEVLSEIDSRSSFVADITKLNFNVIYEIGYAIGRGKPVYIVKNASFEIETIGLSELGIFDTLGYDLYNNSEELTALLLKDKPDLAQLHIPVGLNSRAPIYSIVPRTRTDFVIRCVKRVARAGLHQRQFDPNEKSRLAAFDAIENVAESYGILVPLLAPEVQGARLHNLRSAFVAGLAKGMDRVCLIIQEGDAPVPIDYRDLARATYSEQQVDNVIAEFSAEVTELFQGTPEDRPPPPENLLQSIHLGASIAENEVRDLPAYYLETEEFKRVASGDARVVVGRKGSGKTAIFFRVWDRVRRNPKHVVLDLKPEGYQLRKFRDAVLSLLQVGTQEHLVMAFWEYVLHLELCAYILKKDKERQSRDPTMLRLYKALEARYSADEFVVEGDFADRLNRLSAQVAERYSVKFGDKTDRVLREAEITDLLYRHDLSELRRLVGEYLAQKDEVWILIDNLDKGWPYQGIESTDILVIRTLLEATRKIERDLNKRDVEAHAVVFLRNDVYDLLIEQTSDRGKESKVAVDWLHPDLLREVIYLRLRNSGLDDDNFAAAWRKICTPLVKGDESSQYLIDRCLMRPRALLDLINGCRGVAVSLRHARIEEGDIEKGLALYSDALVSDINLEIRDVMSEAENVLYHFIGGKRVISEHELETLLIGEGAPREHLTKLRRVLIWHGVLGLVLPDGQVEYIYNVNYNMQRFEAQIKKFGATGVKFEVNPAFWPALGVTQ